MPMIAPSLQSLTNILSCPSRQSDDSDTAGSSDLQEATLQEYVYPFRQNVLATLTIPKDATAAEIRRLVAWAQTLAVDYEEG